MLAAPKLKTIIDLVQSSSKEELIWINGYIAGIIQQDTTEVATLPATNVKPKLTIVYGTETGNAKQLATQFASLAKQKKCLVKLIGLDQYTPKDLEKESLLVVVISTQGDGEPPAAALSFYEYLHQIQINLNHLQYAVLGLGDSSYPLFCKTGEDVDMQLNRLGAKRIHELAKCDVDYEADANNWFNGLIEKLLTNNFPASNNAASKNVAIVSKTAKQTYSGLIDKKIVLNDKGSCKQTFHIEIAADSVDYQPGDSIGVYPENPAHVVDEILHLLQVHPEKKFLYKDESYAIDTLLSKKLNILNLSEKIIKKYAALTEQDIPGTRMDLLDLLKIYPLKTQSQLEPFIALLQAQSPRLYTIASSPIANENAIHLTINLERFYINEAEKNGLCSHYLSEMPLQSPIHFFVQKNKRFKLPQDDVPIIMIAHGTGIAPFRSFLLQRDNAGAEGKNWLIFEEDNFTTDFLYQTEIQDWYATGHIHQLHLCFQHNVMQPATLVEKLQHHAATFMQWIEQGAYVFVSGEKDFTGAKLDQAIIDMIATSGKYSNAVAFFQQLKNEGRFVKEVY
ncbi:MAG: sulfite reductase [Hydrotalea flava]|uniref:diflavin oxidoreductase n=1 Tax=Hydrotalea TaxID=1004300 RepID=UPI000945D55E|nr:MULTISPECIES: flavodoxin domain-containing protein [Hydrotalea]MBY0347598.1 flavodoxin domain-containing protein [Hydrotalea flava]NIM36687.1 sulfite reductase [Hydrotalea flava]NIM39547.1 sulfite reductase [Hydrotalea flava]NIN04736.1 sulfite reductase [Hydrotalea flava]NIN16408.1 sulfite reductase [Hydrotalea flava]